MERSKKKRRSWKSCASCGGSLKLHFFLNEIEKASLYCKMALEREESCTVLEIDLNLQKNAPVILSGSDQLLSSDPQFH